MTRDEVIRLAKEAGIGTAFYGKDYEPLIEQIWGGPMRTNELARFAELVAAEEREACAVVCESLFDSEDDSCNEAETCAAAIRARGDSK